MTRWTATSTAPWLRSQIKAQDKSSKATLVKRLQADDPCWRGDYMRLALEPAWPKKAFRRGLCIRAFAEPAKL